MNENVGFLSRDEESMTDRIMSNPLVNIGVGLLAQHRRPGGSIGQGILGGVNSYNEFQRTMMDREKQRMAMEEESRKRKAMEAFAAENPDHAAAINAGYGSQVQSDIFANERDEQAAQRAREAATLSHERAQETRQTPTYGNRLTEQENAMEREADNQQRTLDAMYATKIPEEDKALYWTDPEEYRKNDAKKTGAPTTKEGVIQRRDEDAVDRIKEMLNQQRAQMRISDAQASPTGAIKDHEKILNDNEIDAVAKRRVYGEPDTSTMRTRADKTYSESIDTNNETIKSIKLLDMAFDELNRQGLTTGKIANIEAEIEKWIQKPTDPKYQMGIAMKNLITQVGGKAYMQVMHIFGSGNALSDNDRKAAKEISGYDFSNNPLSIYIKTRYANLAAQEKLEKTNAQQLFENRWGINGLNKTTAQSFDQEWANDRSKIDRLPTPREIEIEFNSNFGNMGSGSQKRRAPDRVVDGEERWDSPP